MIADENTRSIATNINEIKIINSIFQAKIELFNDTIEISTLKVKWNWLNNYDSASVGFLK